jgi:hypothetical protein
LIEPDDDDALVAADEVEGFAAACMLIYRGTIPAYPGGMTMREWAEQHVDAATMHKAWTEFERLGEERGMIIARATNDFDA